MDRFTKVEFYKFKAFENFSMNIKKFNILVGPNNAGKSTILTAFRILEAAMRRARTRRPTVVRGPHGVTQGYAIDLTSLSVAEENIFFNYDDSEPATVKFTLSNKNELLLFFPDYGSCFLIANNFDRPILSPTSFKTHFNCAVGFVPILGPVEHVEPLFDKEAARNALFNYRAARNFRNIWYHYPERFQEFKHVLIRTWPGMDIESPIVDRSTDKLRLHMFCPEDRIPREIFWSGFGFQVWCQMLTHIIQSKDVSIFLIDEPDIYLHSDLQRQLVSILRDLGPDVLIGTHSTEIITEAELEDIVVVNKKKNKARRIKDPTQLGEVFSTLGSNLNPILTQLAKTRRVIFVEGKDFQIIGKFARTLGFSNVGNRSNFAVVPLEGFNPDRVRTLKKGMESTLGVSVSAAVVLDKDYRSADECENVLHECLKFCAYAAIHECKEVENFLLVPPAVDRAIANRIREKISRGGSITKGAHSSSDWLLDFADARKSYIASQYIENRKRFERSRSSPRHEATLSQMALDEFDIEWNVPKKRLKLIPGKDAVSFINQKIQEIYGISVTPYGIIDAMSVDQIDPGMIDLIKKIDAFSKKDVA